MRLRRRVNTITTWNKTCDAIPIKNYRFYFENNDQKSQAIWNDMPAFLPF
jgi:hypothetical protein